jgi:hypothetical protein
MSTNPKTAAQYRTPTTPETPEPQSRTPDRASATAPRTFEPTNTGELPPMFETEADHGDR